MSWKHPEREIYCARFIEKAKAIHGDKYDYSHVEYIDSQTKVRLICRIHGEFFIRPGGHINGHRCGCRKCGNEKIRLALADTQDSFLERARKIHGDRYDYSKTVYTVAPRKIIIICRKHGEFEIPAFKHVMDNHTGCLICGREERAIEARTTQEEFISRAKKTHGEGVYNYDDIKFVRMEENIDVICPKHGPFEISSWKFANRCGCPTCGRERGAKSKRYTTERFVKRCRKRYGDRFDYSLTEYREMTDKVTVSCVKHGPFQILPMQHIQPNGEGGCLKCARESLVGFTRIGFVKSTKKNKRVGRLYFVKCFYRGVRFLKIGITNRPIEKRFTAIWNAELIREFAGDPALVWDLEKLLHSRCKHLLFDTGLQFQGRTECYAIDKVDEILKIWDENVPPTPNPDDSQEKVGE